MRFIKFIRAPISQTTPSDSNSLSKENEPLVVQGIDAKGLGGNDANDLGLVGNTQLDLSAIEGLNLK